MAFFIPNKIKGFKNYHDASIFTVELLVTLKLLSKILNIDCGFAFGYGSVNLEYTQN